MAANVLLVTGGSRGIGAATAQLAGERGYAVCVNYRENGAAAEQVVERITQAGARAVAVAADVSREADVLRLFATVDRELGPLTALVNNAGRLAPQMRVEQHSWDRDPRPEARDAAGRLCRDEARRCRDRRR